MKVYLIAPKNPESFWTFDRVLPSLGKRCVFPNLALPPANISNPLQCELGTSLAWNDFKGGCGSE